MDKEAKSY